MPIVYTKDGEYADVKLDASGNIPMVLGVVSSAPLAYRSAVVAADVIAATGTVTCTKINSVGALTAGVYYIKVVAVNAYGRGVGKAGDVTVTTETTNLCVKAAFAAVVGATHYDIYCSTDAQPLWCGRITEAQRASGIIIDAVGSTAAGGAAASVYIYPVGTGLAAGTTAVVNTAYVVPATPVVATGHQYVDFLISCTRTGDAVAPVLVVIPAVLNSRTSTYFFPVAATTLAFGGTTAAYGPMKQRIQVAVRGEEAVALLVQQVAGTGMSVDMDYVLS